MTASPDTGGVDPGVLGVTTSRTVTLDAELAEARAEIERLKTAIDLYINCDGRLSALRRALEQ